MKQRKKAKQAGKQKTDFIAVKAAAAASHFICVCKNKPNMRNKA